MSQTRRYIGSEAHEKKANKSKGSRVLGCSARQKTFEVGKVCSTCTYYGSLSFLVETAKQSARKVADSKVEPEFVITRQQKEDLR